MQRVFRAKRTNLHEKYDYPELEIAAAANSTAVAIDFDFDKAIEAHRQWKVRSR